MKMDKTRDESQLVPDAGAIIAPLPPEISWQPLYEVSLKLGMQPFNVVAVSLTTSEKPAAPLFMASEGITVVVGRFMVVSCMILISKMSCKLTIKPFFSTRKVKRQLLLLQQLLRFLLPLIA